MSQPHSSLPNLTVRAVNAKLPGPIPARRLVFVSDLDGNVLELIGPV